MRKGERRAGVGTVEGSFGEERNGSVESKGRVHVVCPAATGHRIQISGKHPAERW